MSRHLINLAAIQQARANLKALAEAHPELLGPSTPEQWMKTLSPALSVTDRQQDLIHRRQAQGLQRVTHWISREDREALRQRYPGPRNGIDWQQIIDAAIANKPALQNYEEKKP